MSKHVISKEQAEEICKKVYSVAEFCREVGWQPRGANYNIFYKYVKDYNLDMSHFTGQRSNLGNKHNVGISNEEYFREDKLIKGSELVKRLINKAGRKYECEICGIKNWNNKHISLQVHHIDGDHFNNKLENLQILCPNCHSQTKNYSGNKNSTSNHVIPRVYKNTCKECGKRLHKKTKSGLCISCFRKSQINKSASKKS